ncbi:cation:proton antiporter [Thiobaca trueperi]|uniref:Sodium/proton antiporter (CPA1 family) n=1 Tax=Thiobaca trueperi TaxID=127458 RepID=A0A4R3MZR5_9GAMM|nr:sodium:proton antiporter [Thiobaca trueperi]TCT20253.1 sodium/proton antiporter (CPA1 family) [Thiobaca trueperi]
MRIFDIVAALITLSALFSWFNHRFLKLPTVIGLMLIALLMSLALLLPIPGTEWLEQDAKRMLASIEFDETLLHGMLSFLLFAGALHVRLSDLARHKWVIALLASAGVLISTLIVAAGAWLIFFFIGLDVPLIYCLLFGALISPTDPIAVLSILKQAQAPKSLETKITGESLFNDGVAVVLFLVLLDIAIGDKAMHPGLFLTIFLQEAVGGLALGLFSGGLAYLMMRSIDHYQVEVLITLAVASGAYAVAEHWHVSAPITVVVAGLLIGNLARDHIISDETLRYLDSFWELIDEILNAVLFVLIGLEVMILTMTVGIFTAGLLAIPLVLAARAISTGLPIAALTRFRHYAPGVVAILTWGGLRGGISVAMALALPHGEVRDVLVSVTYIVVVFSILVQGLSLGPVIRATGRRADLEFDHADFAGRIPDQIADAKPES